jgi:outer membrane lipoprotein-sorting protein
VKVFLLAIALLCSIILAADPTTQPAPLDPALSARLTEIDAKAGKIQSIVADFRQEKFTALLTKPLISTGTIRVRGAEMRWDTLKPDRSVLAINPAEAKVYYPDQKVLEIYALDRRLGELAASPLPRLASLKQRFSFASFPLAELMPDADPKHYVALSLKPLDPVLQQHVEEVRVLLDADQGCMVKAEVLDGDGDKTSLTFLNVKLNADAGDLNLAVPAGTRVTKPLEGLGGGKDPGR